MPLAATGHLLGAGEIRRHQPGGAVSGRVALPGRRSTGSSRTPKSSSFGVPSAVTRMLSGLMSRWTTRFWWAYWTPLQTRTNSSSRSATDSRALVAVGVDAYAVDVLHDEVGLAGGRAAAVDQPGDVAMIEIGQGLPFAAETVDDAGRVGPRPDDLDGGLPRERVVGALGAVDHAHAAAADDVHDAPRIRATAPIADRATRSVTRTAGVSRKVPEPSCHVEQRSHFAPPPRRRRRGCASSASSSAGPRSRRLVEQALVVVPARVRADDGGASWVTARGPLHGDRHGRRAHASGTRCGVRGAATGVRPRGRHDRGRAA